MERSTALEKLAIYGSNFIVRPLGRLLDKSISLGNPYGAIAYGVLDIFRSATPSIKNNKYIRLIEAGGFGFYTAKTIINLVSLAKGDFDSCLEIPFNASMAFQIGKNTIEDYKGKSLKGDLKEIPQDFKKVFDPPKIKSS